MKYVESIRDVLALQRIAGLPHEMRNINDGQGIGALHDHQIAVDELTKGLTGPQRRQGTLQATKIEMYRRKSNNHVWRRYRLWP